MNVRRCAILSIVLVTSPLVAPAQEPVQEKRDLVLDSGQTAARPDATPRGPLGARPELVLQTGISKPQVHLAFSRDGRMLASLGISGASIKLWDVATGRLLRQLSANRFVSVGGLGVNRAFAFSPDGGTLVMAVDGAVLRWDVATGRALPQLATSLAMRLYSLVVSDDASVIVAGAIDRQGGGPQLRCWETATGRELSTLQIEEDEHVVFQTLTVSANGDRAAAVGVEASRTESATSLFIWDVATGRRICKTDARSGAGRSLSREHQSFGIAFSPDGARVAMREATSLTVWDASSGRTIAAGQSGRQTHLRTGDLLTPYRSQIAVSPDGRLVGLQSDDGALELFDAGSAALARTLDGHEGAVLATAFSGDGRLVATSGADNVVKIRELASGDEVRVLRGEMAVVADVAFSSDGQSLAVAGTQAVSSWDVASGDLRRPLTLPEEFRRPSWERTTVPRHYLSPDGRFVVAGSGRGPLVKVWDVSTGAEVSTVSLAQGRELSNAVFSPDGGSLAVIDRNDEQTRAPRPRPASQATTLQGMDRKTLMEEMRKNPKKFQEQMAKLQEVMKGGNPSEMMARLDAAGMIPEELRPIDLAPALRIVDLSTGRPARDLPLPDGRGVPLTQGAPDSMLSQSLAAFSSDGRYLALSPEIYAPIKITDVTTGKPMSEIALSTPITMATSSSVAPYSVDIPYGMAWSPDARLLATTGVRTSMDLRTSKIEYDRILELWDPQTGRSVRRLVGLDGAGLTLAFGRGGTLLAVGGFAGAVELVDVATGRVLRRLEGHAGPVRSVSFGPDDRYLLSGGEDGSARLWDPQTGELLATLVCSNDGADWLAVTPDGLFDGSPGGWNQILWRFAGGLLDLTPVESYFADFYYPGLLADLLAGKRPKAALNIAERDRRQPKLEVTLAGGVGGGPVSGRTATVRVAISDAPAGARDVRLFRNGSLVKLWRGDVLDGRSTATLEADVTLVAGRNRLTAYAFNRDNVKSVDAMLAVTGAESLERPGTVHLLAVGVNEYANPQYNLKYASADARDFADEVERQQQKLGVYPKTETTLLVDRDATKANVLLALGRLAGAELPRDAPAAIRAMTPVAPEDVVVVFFAGHGTAQGDRFYLLPHDLGYAGERTRLDAEGLRTILAHGLSDLELERAVEGIDAGHALVVIDACNSGQALEADDARRGPMNSKGLAQLAYDKGIYVLTAAQSFQVALEATALGHGLLTYSLVEEGLKTPSADGRPKDGRVELREWLDFATDRVPRLEETTLRHARDLVLGSSATTTPSKTAATRTLQRPRVFYRREAEARPLVVAGP